MPSTDMPSSKALWFLHSLLLLWLLTWIFLSWGAVQDDAFIHFRYASNLRLHSFITYDGVHPDYGTSSLLYVGILAALRGLSESPQLPRAVSSVVHLLLFAGIALGCAVLLPRGARLARLAGVVLLALLVTPSAVRWLDDGMETGLAIVAATVLAWRVHRRAAWPGASRRQDILLGVIAFLAVMLRTELLLLCGAGALVLAGQQLRARRLKMQNRRFSGTSIGMNASVGAIAVGAGAAVGLIFATMHVLLPDTAVAKSHGIAHWFNPIHDTAVTLAGAFSFGAGMLGFWLLTVLLVARHSGIGLKTVVANCLCPVVLSLAALRGQEIQGVRYFAWTFFFSIVWNILELAEIPREGLLSSRAFDRKGTVLVYGFLGLLLVELPVESVEMHRVLTHRAATEKLFASGHLDVLRMRRGVASDIGYIGYFTGAEMCDLAGLVNGRAAAKLGSSERVIACAQTSPDFVYLNVSQLESMKSAMDLTGWQVCGRYGFANVRTEDVHSLLVRPGIAEETCRAAGSRADPIEGL